MLSILFKKQLIQLQIVPVFGYAELKTYYRDLDSGVNSVILVGFGGYIDLETFLDIEPEQQPGANAKSEPVNVDSSSRRSVYVLDGHRPWNLDNIFGSDTIRCLDDGTVEDSLGTEKEAYANLLQLQEEHANMDEAYYEEEEEEEEEEEQGEATDRDDDESSDDNNAGSTDADEEDGERGTGVERRTNGKRDRSKAFNDVTDEDNKSSDRDTSNKTSLSETQRRIKRTRRLMHQNERVIEDYYTQGTTVVNSVSSQVYSLLSAIGETNIQQLWLAILGATSLDTAYSSVYNRLCPLLQDEVKRLQPLSRTRSVGNSNNSNDNGYAAGSGDILKSLKTPDTLSLEIQPDYYLFLLRHSSLYDSFFYSNYVNAKLSLWNENGKKRLHKMFARMGIPLTTAQESWIYMDHSIKRDLGMIFEKNLDRYGLQDIIRDGFVRTRGYRGSISASEFVEAITALLEVGDSLGLDDRILGTVVAGNGNNNGSSGGSSDPTSSTDTNYGGNSNTFNKARETGHDGVSADRQTGGATSNSKTDDEDNHRRWVSNFWLSWDALDDNKSALLAKGIKYAQFLQRMVFSTGVTILERKLIKHLRIYRLCVLRDDPNLSLYQNPLTLMRLGNWLIECCAEAEDKQLLPMVLAALNETTDTYLVAGLTPRYPRGLDTALTKKPVMNHFSMAFQQITAQTGAKVKIDNFESSIIEIKRDDLSPFLEKLTLSGLL